MRSRLFRLFLAFAIPISLIVFLSSLALPGAKLHLAWQTSQSNTMLPNGHGIAFAQRVSTTSIPQVRGTGEKSKGQLKQENSDFDPVPDTHSIVSKVPGVVQVPRPTGSDPSANEGISNGSPPSDSNGAGGTDNYIETINRQFAIFDRSGNLQYTTTYQNWFGNLSGGATHFYDVNVIWDHYGSRFIFIVDTGKLLLLSVAQQSDANAGDFCNYAFPAAGADFDKLGANYKGVYFSANIVNAQGVVVDNILILANRTQLETCTQNVNYTSWSNLRNGDGSIAQAITPALQNTTSPGGVEYLVNSIPLGACVLTVWTLNPTSTTLAKAPVYTQCYAPPPKAPEAGSGAIIDPGDSSVTHASYVNGLMTLAITGSYDFGDGNGPVGIVEWFIINPANPNVFRQGAFGTPGVWSFYPAVVQNGTGNLLFVYEISGPNDDPGIWYVNQTFTGTQALAQGASYYGDSGGQPWGDYASAWLDVGGPNHNAVWITGMYANGTNSWGTKFGLVTP